MSINFETLPAKEPLSPEPPPKEPVVLEWVCHPAKRNTLVTVLVTLFLVVIIGAVYFATYSVWFTLLGAVIMIASLGPFYLPTRYKLTDDEITVKSVTQTMVKSWSQYRTCYPDKNGVLLSPFVRPSRLENFRGLYIRFSGNKEKVVAFVKERLGSGDVEPEGK